MDAKDLLFGRIEDLAAKAKKTGCAASRFFTPAEANSIAERFSRSRDITLTLDGGYNEAERTRAVLMNPDWGTYERSELFSALGISFRPPGELRHHDILGALMSLGIERDVLGDIITGDSFAAVICLPEMCGYIAENLTRVGRIGVATRKIHLDELPVKTENLMIKPSTVASLRLDVMICAAFGFSRGEAAEMITSGLCSLNYECCCQPAKEVTEGAVLSVRGAGRAVVLEVGGISRKGRIFVKIGLYGR